MKTLVINAGSSSLKYQLINMENEAVLAKGGVERIGLANAFLVHKYDQKEIKIEDEIKDHGKAIELVLNALTSNQHGVLKSLNELEAFGHRVVHGGEKYTKSIIITPEVLKGIEENAALAPLHVPANVMGIKACIKTAPNIPNVAVFDTAFHSEMPAHAYMYGLPQKAYKEYKIRKYGFHGTSHYFVANRVAEHLNKPLNDLKVITCHLGNGSSVTAIKDGHSIDTSMGFTPLEGLMMGTRSGDIDPAILEYLMEKTGWDIKRATSYLNKESGLLGVSGVSSDMRDLLEAEKTNENARLALNMLAYKVKKYIGAYTAAMGGVDAIVFTAGIGEKTEMIRENALKGLEFLGLELDHDKNNNPPKGEEFEISKEGSQVKVFIIPTNEELVIANETHKLIKKH